MYTRYRARYPILIRIRALRELISLQYLPSLQRMPSGANLIRKVAYQPFQQLTTEILGYPASTTSASARLQLCWPKRSHFSLLRAGLAELALRRIELAIDPSRECDGLKPNR
jgi:hypothetical protein